MLIVAIVLRYAAVFRGSSKFLPSLVPAFGWGAMFPIADSAIKHVDPFHLTAIRYILAAIGFIALLWAIEGRRALRLQGRGLELFLLGSAGIAGFNLFAFAGPRAHHARARRADRRHQPADHAARHVGDGAQGAAAGDARLRASSRCSACCS